MKLTDEIKRQIVTDIAEIYPFEAIEFLDDEFVWVTVTREIKNSCYPLLGHVCGRKYSRIESLRFFNHERTHSFYCGCDKNVYPNKYKALYALHHLDI